MHNKKCDSCDNAAVSELNFPELDHFQRAEKPVWLPYCGRCCGEITDDLQRRNMEPHVGPHKGVVWKERKISN